jgi:hypothetical protein
MTILLWPLRNFFMETNKVISILLYLCIKFQCWTHYSLSVTKKNSDRIQTIYQSEILFFHCSFVIRNFILKFYTQIEYDGNNIYNFFIFYYKLYYSICTVRPRWTHDTFSFPIYIKSDLPPCFYLAHERARVTRSNEELNSRQYPHFPTMASSTVICRTLTASSPVTAALE